MRNLRIWLVTVVVVAAAAAAHADNNSPVDCGKKSLADAVRNVSAPDTTITFTGVCVGPIVITADGLTLKGVGTAVIDGGGQDAVTIVGVGGVSLVDFEVTNGVTGIVARQGAHVSMSGVHAHDNSQSGLALQTASSAVLSDVSLSNNARLGVMADDGVSLIVTTSTMTGNLVKDIQLTFGARADLRTLTFGTYTCDATVLVRGTSGIVCPH